MAEEEGEDLMMNLMEDTDEEVPSPPNQLVKSPLPNNGQITASNVPLPPPPPPFPLLCSSLRFPPERLVQSSDLRDYPAPPPERERCQEAEVDSRCQHLKCRPSSS